MKKPVSSLPRTICPAAPDVIWVRLTVSASGSKAATTPALELVMWLSRVLMVSLARTSI